MSGFPSVYDGSLTENEKNVLSQWEYVPEDDLLRTGSTEKGSGNNYVLLRPGTDNTSQNYPLQPEVKIYVAKNNSNTERLKVRWDSTNTSMNLYNMFARWKKVG